MSNGLQIANSSEPSAHLIGPYLQSVGVDRWFYAEELFIILSAEESTSIGMSMSSESPTNPQNGQIYVYSGKEVSFKNDGVVYAKKKGQDRAQETYQNIKVNGVDMIRGIYSRAEDKKNFRRRIYRLIARPTHAQQLLFLVHYRECHEDERPETKHSLHPLIFDAFNRMYVNWVQLQRQQQPHQQHNNYLQYQNQQNVVSGSSYNQPPSGQLYMQQQQQQQQQQQMNIHQHSPPIATTATAAAVPAVPVASSSSSSSYQQQPQQQQQQSLLVSPHSSIVTSDNSAHHTYHINNNNNNNNNDNSSQMMIDLNREALGDFDAQFMQELLDLDDAAAEEEAAAMMDPAATSGSLITAPNYYSQQNQQQQQQQQQRGPPVLESTGGNTTNSHAAQQVECIMEVEYSSTADSAVYSGTRENSSFHPEVPYEYRTSTHKLSQSEVHSNLLHPVSSTPAVPPSIPTSVSLPVNLLPPQPAALLKISDFSPSQEHQQRGGSKVLVCLTSEISSSLLSPSESLVVCFGTPPSFASAALGSSDSHTYKLNSMIEHEHQQQELPAQQSLGQYLTSPADIVTPTVLRCRTPCCTGENLRSRRCQVWIAAVAATTAAGATAAAGAGEVIAAPMKASPSLCRMLSEPAEDWFDFIFPVSIGSIRPYSHMGGRDLSGIGGGLRTHSWLGKRGIARRNGTDTGQTATTNASNSQQQQPQQPQHQSTLHLLQPQQLGTNFFPGNPSSSCSSVSSLQTGADGVNAGNSGVVNETAVPPLVPVNYSSDSEEYHKETKIRIVEKLASANTVMMIPTSAATQQQQQQQLSEGMHAMNDDLMDNSTGTAVSSTNTTNNDNTSNNADIGGIEAPGQLTTEYSFEGGGLEGTGNVKWLNDQELSEMSAEDLEVIMDRYIMVVVKQLVQLAAMDDDLKAEIDSLDASGFSLLHYCCLYNLNSLVPVLLARGADVNRRTATGTTALHLAAGAGHAAVTQLLVESGAVVDVADANNMLPSDVAYHSGFMQIYELLLMLENRFPSSRETSAAVKEMTVEMKDAHSAMLEDNRTTYAHSTHTLNQLAAPSSNSSSSSPTASASPLLATATATGASSSSVLAAAGAIPFSSSDRHRRRSSSATSISSMGIAGMHTTTNGGGGGNSPIHGDGSFEDSQGVGSVLVGGAGGMSPSILSGPAATSAQVVGTGSELDSQTSSALSNKLLHEAFASLSLTDKCALSLSFSQMSGDGGGATVTAGTAGAAAAASGGGGGSSGRGSSANTPRSTSDTVTGMAPTVSSNTTGISPVGYRNGTSGGGGVGSGGGSISTGSGGVTSYDIATALSGGVHGDDSHSSNYLDTTTITIAGTGTAGSVAGSVDDSMSEMQSVLSEQDKESLDVAMSMMGQFELKAVEDEVRTIQHNVRAWILRKNYTNLRESARFLQSAWREKKKGATTTSAARYHTVSSSASATSVATSAAAVGRGTATKDKNTATAVVTGPQTAVEFAEAVSNGNGMAGNCSPRPAAAAVAATGGTTVSPLQVPSAVTVSSSAGTGTNVAAVNAAAASGVIPTDRELSAAATLQAVTRGMIARKSFTSVRKQTMASLVIQKGLMKWYTHHNNKTMPAFPPPPPPRPLPPG